MRNSRLPGWDDPAVIKAHEHNPSIFLSTSRGSKLGKQRKMKSRPSLIQKIRDTYPNINEQDINKMATRVSTKRNHRGHQTGTGVLLKHCVNVAGARWLMSNGIGWTHPRFAQLSWVVGYAERDYFSLPFDWKSPDGKEYKAFSDIPKAVGVLVNTAAIDEVCGLCAYSTLPGSDYTLKDGTPHMLIVRPPLISSGHTGPHDA